jgi:hypothetical protein
MHGFGISGRADTQIDAQTDKYLLAKESLEDGLIVLVPTLVPIIHQLRRELRKRVRLGLRPDRSKPHQQLSLFAGTWQSKNAQACSKPEDSVRC